MSVTLRATSIGSLAAKTLKTRVASEVIGQVVNTFPNSFYVKTSSGELLFVTNRSLRSPLTVNVDSTIGLDQIVKPLDLMYSHGSQIRLSEATIDLDLAASFEQEPLPRSEQLDSALNKAIEALHAVIFILSIIDTQQSVLDRRGLTHDGVESFVNDGVLALRNQGMEWGFCEAALRIVGLGFGFTPSGDDTLGGFLAAYNALAEGAKRSPIVLDFPMIQDKTSWISGKLLDYMQRLVLDEQLDLTIRTAAKGDANALTLALESLLPRGHTSGIDIVAGEILGLSTIRDIVSDAQETEVIARELGLL